VIAQDEGQEAHPLGAFYLFGALGKNSHFARGDGDKADRQREAEVSFQMRRGSTMRETLI